MKDNDNDDDEIDETDVEFNATNPKIDHIGHIQHNLKNYPVHYFPNDNLNITQEAKTSVRTIARTLSQRYRSFRTVLSKFKDDDR